MEKDETRKVCLYYFKLLFLLLIFSFIKIVCFCDSSTVAQRSVFRQCGCVTGTTTAETTLMRAVSASTVLAHQSDTCCASQVAAYQTAGSVTVLLTVPMVGTSPLPAPTPPSTPATPPTSSATTTSKHLSFKVLKHKRTTVLYSMMNAVRTGFSFSKHKEQYRIVLYKQF